MGVPHFSTWLTNRYPLVKSSYNQNTLPLIDWLFIDLNDIVYKCALDESSAFKDVLKGKKFEDIFIQIFNYINEITQLVQPLKMLFLTLDGVAPRAKMNQQRARRFKSAKQYQELEIALRSLGILEKEEHFKNNSISPGTEFMHELSKQIKFLIQRKMKEDERWRKISVVFSGVDVPGESEHKILEYIRRKSQQNGFNPNTTMCFYGSDADFIVLTLTTHLPFLCVLQEQSNPRPRLTPATKRQQQQNSYEFLWVNVLREYFEAEFGQLKEKMGDRYNVDRVIDDFVFLCFFIANDFLPRVFCMDSKAGNLDKVIEIFKETLGEIDGYINNKGMIVWQRAAVLLQKIAQCELKFIEDRLEEQQMQQKAATNYNKVLEEVDTITIQSNREVLLEVKELKEEYEELERLEREEELSMSSDSEDEKPTITRIKKVGSISTPRKAFPRKGPGKTSVDFEEDVYAEDLDFKGLNDSNSYDSTSKSYTGDNNNVFNEDEMYRDKKSDRGDEEDKQLIQKQEGDNKKGYIDEYLGEVYANSQDAEATKLEEAENYLLTYTNEENVLRQLSARALDNDIKFMTNLVKTYKQNKNDAQKLFYEEKFGINTMQDSSELTRILVSYIQGLQYVSSYYYTNSPSWDWYYPYYCSPLLSDLANMMIHLNTPQIVQGLIRFSQGKPYDPFKQLLLILPQTSLHLLPESLQALVSGPECPLSKYFPTEFQIDPFGAVSDSDYIAKIPFIDENVLEAEYQKALKENKFTKGELARNVIGSNFVYEWNPKLYEYEVESTLPLYFDKFRAKIKVSQFGIEDMAFDPTKILERPPQGTYKYHRSFPCLNFIQEKKFEFKDHQKKGTTFLRCCIRLGQRLNLTEYKQYRKLLDQPFYSMYPFLLGCFVMGIVTPDQLITNVPYQDLPFRYKKAFHRDYYMSLNTNVHDFYFSQMGVLFKESMMYFALIYLESEVRKDSLGNIYSLKPRMAAIPLNLLIDTNVMPKYRGKIDYSPKDLTKEFLMHSEVVINIGPPAGSLARVVGYKSETSDFDNVEVKIVKTPPKLGAVTTAIAAKYDDHRNYRSVYHVAKRLGVDVQVVLHVLDRLIIKSEASLNTKSLYPERFDIGLNFIHRKNHTIVAELVICNELRKQRKSRYRTFTHFQLAPEAINLLKNYYTNHKAVFEAIANKIRLGDPSPLTAKFIFPNAEDPNLEAFKIYVWILKQENSNLSLTNKASKVIPREGIRELEKVLGGSKNYLGEQAKHILNKVFPYNPNFLIPKSADNWVPPFYSKQPPWHKLGDRVVNLRINGCNFAPFGAVGTVVGILGNKPENGLWKVKIEVMFDYPFIGGTNLGGRCSWGRGAVINFDDIFNLKRWEKCIQARDPKRSFFNQSWDGVFPNSYVPSFQTASEISDTEEDSTRANQPNIPKSTILPEDLLLKHLSDKKKEAEKREVLRKKNKNQTTKRPEKRESSPTKTSIVPKTLGLLKKAENQNEENLVKEIVEKPAETKVIKPFNEDAFREPSPDTQNKLDFNTLISNTLPPTLNTETLQNTSFSISSRFSIGNTSMPDIASHMRSPVYHTWAQDEESILDMKEDLYKMNTMQSKTPNILKSDRIETLRKIGDRRNTIEPLIDFAFKPIKVAEKENIQNTMYNLRREVEVENNDTEDGGGEQIFIEVSQGGRLVKEETITLEIVERKDVKLG